MVRLSTLNCSITKPGLLTVIGVAARPDKNARLHPGIAVCRRGEDISIT